MKKLLLSAAIIAIAFTGKAQSVAINSSGTTANASSILDVSSTSKGALLPRMTVAQRNAISSPATGLMIYQTDAGAGMYVYTGSEWKNMSPIQDLIATRNSTAQTIATISNADVVFNNATLSPSLSGASYNTSTGEYTVGVSGNYLITVSLASTSAAFASPMILVNSNVQAVGPGVSSTNLSAGYLGRGTLSIVLTLSASDVIKINAANSNTANAVTLTTDGSTRIGITKL